MATKKTSENEVKKTTKKATTSKEKATKTTAKSTKAVEKKPVEKKTVEKKASESKTTKSKAVEKKVEEVAADNAKLEELINEFEKIKAELSIIKQFKNNSDKNLSDKLFLEIEKIKEAFIGLEDRIEELEYQVSEQDDY